MIACFAVAVLPAASVTVSATSYVPGCVYVCETASPLPAPVLSPHVHWPAPARPDVASEAVACSDTSSPTLTAAEATPIVTVGGVRSTTTPSQFGADRFAFSAVALWFGPFGLSGIDASAASTQAHTVPSGIAP